MAYSYSVDGYGDRDDMALARDRDQGRILENQTLERLKSIPEAEYAESVYQGLPITQIVREMAQANQHRRLYYKHQIFWDVESIHDAVEQISLEAITPDGEDEPVAADLDWFTPHLNDKGHEVEIYI